MTTSASAFFAVSPLTGVDPHRTDPGDSNSGHEVGTRVVGRKGKVLVRCILGQNTSTSAAIALNAAYTASVSAGGYRVQLYSSGSAGEFAWAITSADVG